MTDLNEYTPPQFSYDLMSEQALLKIAMGGDALALQLCGDLIEMFWDNRHRLLASVLSGMYHHGQYVDPVSVLAVVTAEGQITKLPGPYLHTVHTGPGDHEGVIWYAGRVREMAARRGLREATLRVTQKMEWGWANGDDVEVAAALREFRGACDAVEATSRGEEQGGPQPLSEFLDGPTDEDWLVPGLLERRERIILTGSEGLGKSVLCSQLAACMAGGVHPFTGSVLGSGNRGVRVLVVDAENSAVQSRRRYRSIIAKVDRLRVGVGLEKVDWKSQALIDIRPEGLDLLTGRDVGSVEHAIGVSAPDLVVLGPLYKLFNADPSDEKAVREVAGVLDGLRSRHGFALLLEAHAGKGEDHSGARRMAPIGSSLWMRWPEYGFGIRRSREAKSEVRPELVDVVSWRGTREERQWPGHLRHGSKLPWEPTAERDTPDPVPGLSQDLDDPQGWWAK